MDASVASSKRPGRVLAITKYEVTGEIGHGGMATVFRARDPRLGRDVALKVIHPHLRESTEIRARFSMEAQAVAKLRHPNIVEVYDVAAPDEPEQYLVVELLGGLTLRQLLKERGPMLPEVAAAIGLEILAALGHAHAAGVVHRDVKPENVMVESRPASEAAVQRGGRVAVKLMDFGIAKLLDAQGVTSTGQVLGSPAHMAPEQIEGGEVDGRADLFSLGVLLYECMVGRLPFEGSNPAQVLRRVLDAMYTPAERASPEVGAGYSRVLARALAKRPEDRYANAAEMRDALQAELTRLGVTDPKAELEAWLEDAEVFVAAFRPRIIGALRAEAAEARRRGDTLAAAADYNRALAYAPSDPQLLKEVATLHRASVRARWMRKGAALAGLVAGAGLASVALVRGLRARAPVPIVVMESPPVESPEAGVAPGPAIAEAPTTVTDAAVTSRPGRPNGGSSPVPMARNPGVVATGAARPAITRELTIASVRPPFGVLVRVDGSSPQEVTAGLKLALDGRAHALHFACVNDVCEPMERAIVAGDKDETLDVALSVRPATLTVDGDRNLNYQITEEPSILIQPGISVRVPMRGSRYRVTVTELPSGRTRLVTLTAGKDARVSFSDGP